MKITESITAHLSMKEITDMIEEHALKEGYQVVKVIPEMEKEYSRDPRDNGSITGYKFTGFKVDLKRKSIATPKLGGNSYYDR